MFINAVLLCFVLLYQFDPFTIDHASGLILCGVPRPKVARGERSTMPFSLIWLALEPAGNKKKMMKNASKLSTQIRIV